MNKVLIIRFSAIGDLILTSPIIRCLKNQLTNSEIHFLTKENLKIIAENNPYVSKNYYLNKTNFSKTLDALKKENYDYVIDLHNNLRSMRIKLSLGAKSRTVKKHTLAKYILVKFKINKYPKKHIVDRFFDHLSSLKITNDNQGLEYFIPVKDEIEQEWLPETHRGKYIAVVLGGKYNTKRLPAKRLIELCDRINQPIVLLGGPEDVELSNVVEDFFKKGTDQELEAKLVSKLKKKTTIFNAVGKFNLNQSADLIRKSHLVFSHDTALMHMAAAFKKKVYSIWGSTVPEFGFYPYQTKFVIFENKNIGCRPCSKLGFSNCPKGHFKCMNELNFDFYIPED